jgi:hypothetical protein
MSKSLFEIQSEYEVLLSTLEQAGNLPPEQQAELIELLSINEAEFKGKAEAYAITIRAKQARASELKAEAKRLSDWAKTEENLAERLTERILSAMQHQGLAKAETEHYRFGLRNSVAVDLDIEPDALPEGYKRVKTVIEADKTAIKAALERGESIPGARLVQRQSLQIR